MKKSKIEELINLIKDTAITELSWSEGDSKISLKQVVPGSEQKASLPVVAQTAPVVAANTVSSEPSVPAAVVSNLHEVKSPMVGTYYEAASPDDSPFVKVGDRVQKGQVLCIIEAMKLMNEIESDKDGIVSEICLVNEAPVEYDTVLFRIR